jgi:transcriptional regulator with XRE-family HTH domain
VTGQRALGKTVQFLREDLNMTRGQLAERSGVPAVELASIEEGKTDPSWGTTRALAGALGVSLESLAERAEGFYKQADGK